LLIVAGVTGLFWFFENVKPVSSQISYVNFNVPAGSTATQISKSLQTGLIKNPTTFKVYVWFTGLSNRIQAGTIVFPPALLFFRLPISFPGHLVEVRVTIQEGLRREEIAAKFQEFGSKSIIYCRIF
jgi:cell division protein YceG involved in septum cleavage